MLTYNEKYKMNVLFLVIFLISPLFKYLRPIRLPQLVIFLSQDRLCHLCIKMTEREKHFICPTYAVYR